MFVVKHPDQIVYGSRPHPSALRPYCSNIEHPSVDILQKGHSNSYQNYIWRYSEGYIFHLKMISVSLFICLYDVALSQKGELWSKLY